MRRFWTTTAVAEGEGGWLVLLDGRPMRTPGGAALRVPARAVAEAVAEEWAAAGEAGAEIRLADLVLSRMVATALDRIAHDPVPTIDVLAKYGETDLLCYRTAYPPELAARQAQAWQPLLDWAALALDAPLVVTSGLAHVAQSPAALAALRAALARENPFSLAALGVAVPALGSLVLGLALAHGRVGPDEAHAIAFLEEAFQAEQWGKDAEAEARLAGIAAEVATAHRLMVLARVEAPA